ncbi:MAG TPA: twin-arginine translocase TatA/TatE family subunit [Thermoanaerobaculia bacterium]|nr:twin-arginine translocase TatA/TatE family subunit [Thermoanaerobaculia bacterium]
MGSLGLPEIAFIVIIALLIFGPKKLPEIGRTLGRGMAEFRRATDELKRAVNTELALDESPLPPVLRTRRIEDPVEPAAIAPVPGEAPAMTEARPAGFPMAAEPMAEPAAAPEPVAVPAPELPEPPR